jgi:exopolysaccharide biosynthesis polyprenyl glycosylphosphotransferase
VALASLLAVFLTTYICALGLTYLARKIALRYQIGDMPSERKVHKVFTPYLGGAAILLSIIIGTVLSIYLLPMVAEEVPRRYYFLGITGVLIALVGLYDDIKKLRFSTKFYFQILAAIIVVLGGLRFESLYIPIIGEVGLGWFSIIFTILWIVFITNAMNLLDGLDGLAAGVSTIIFLAFALVALHSGRTLVALVCLLFIAANLGFLKFNSHPASIFMGDTGSLFIGFSTAVISLEVGRIGHTNCLDIIIPLTILAVPILDTTISFFRRINKHMNPFMADKEHIHHRLMSIGFSHKNAVKVMYFLSIIAGFIGCSFIYLDNRAIVTILFAGAIFVGLVIRRLGYFEIEKNLIVVPNGTNNNSKTNGFSNGHSEPRFIPFDTSQFIQSFIFFLSDVLFIVGSFLAVYYWQIVPNLLPEQLLTPYNLILWIAWSVIYWTSLLGLNNLYRIEWDTSRVDEIFTVFKIIFFGTIVLFFLSFEFKIPFLPSRRILVTYGIFLVTGISVGRLVLITILKKYNLLEFKKRPTLIIGASRRALNVVRKINSVPELKFNIVGMVDDHANGNIGKIIEGVPIIGSFENIPEIIKKRKIKEVIIALDDNNMNQVIDMIDLFSRYNVSIKLLPDFYNLLTGFRTSHIYGVSLVKFFGSNMKTWEWVLKRLIDIIISLVVLIGFLPIWLIISLIIKLDSPGPVFYKQKRIGKNRREFEVIKFRSMVQGAEQETGPKWAEKNDPRVTRFGKFLRKTGLDEIPQFFNVLMGDMSIVGPRPERDYFVNELERSIQFYSRRLIIKPGITGWAQIKYKYDETIDDVREKLRYDLYYIENMSVILDLKIIIQTLLIGLRRKHRTSYV